MVSSGRKNLRIGCFLFDDPRDIYEDPSMHLHMIPQNSSQDTQSVHGLDTPIIDKDTPQT